jgi:type IV secretion system protein VirB9
MKISKQIAIILLLVFSFAKSYGDVPITIDNRIKTYVYSENEVFLVLVHYGYQSSIEFAKDEEIETISVGDIFAWKITPAGRRLFIKSMERDLRTNMTIITNKRTYLFDIMSKAQEDEVDPQLAYMIRFFYPDKLKQGTE